ncbi:MAG TPA: nuclear transport factor 2 family protein [Longimicrobiaceae bacterium]
MRTSSLLASVLVCASCAGATQQPAPGAAGPPGASAPGDTAGALAAQRGWWRAFVVADTAYLRARTSPELSLTLSGGRTYDRPAMLVQAATHTRGAGLEIGWAEESVRLAAPGVALVTSRGTEADGPRVAAYRYLTVLRRDGAGWRVTAAQSTRELAPTPRVPAAAAGPPADFAGAYRTPRGGVLRVVARDSALVLVEPSGQEVRMEPIGPGLFELDYVTMGSGIVRFAFPRDAGGRVTALVRLVTGMATTFPRMP